jgi:ribosomal protein S6
MIDIPRDVQTRLYELTYLVPASLTESELTIARQSIEKLIAKHTGKVVLSEAWGKQEMAYRIRYGSQRHAEANYVHVVVEFLPEKAYAFEKELYLQDGIMRHLFVLSEVTSKDEVKQNS